MSDRERQILNDLILIATFKKTYGITIDEDLVLEKQKETLFEEYFKQPIILNNKIYREPQEPITAEQLEVLEGEIGDNHLLKQSLLKTYDCLEIKELPKSEYKTILTELRRIRQL